MTLIRTVATRGITALLPRFIVSGDAIHTNRRGEETPPLDGLLFIRDIYCLVYRLHRVLHNTGVTQESSADASVLVFDFVLLTTDLRKIALPRCLSTPAL